MVDVTRRQFLAVTGASLAGSSLALMGFSSVALAEARRIGHTTGQNRRCKPVNR